MDLILTDIALPDLEHGADAEIIDVTTQHISSCTGCFGCWTRTPGVCVINDDARSICAKVARCGRLLIVSRMVLGCYALPLKRLLERLLPNQQPFIRAYAGETHHVQRYDKPVQLDVIAYGAGDAREEAVFRNWLARNVLNMPVLSHSVALAGTPDAARQLAREVVAGWAN